MCGFAGYFSINPVHWDRPVLQDMTATLIHRGPDDDGYWYDCEGRFGLGFRRLSIIDLSPAGHQPMQSASGRYIIAFNGEIYNYRELRAELDRGKGGIMNWRGHSDTEVMLACIDEWGLESALSRFNGMFAFAIWDRQESTLRLVRDRFGEKPLYYGWMGDTFLFGSELKALKAHPAWRGEIDRGALALFTRYNYVPSPYSIYEGISKLQPGHVLTLSTMSSGCKTPQIQTYWSPKDTAEAGIRHPYALTEKELVDELDTLLRDAVRLRMEADVPLGAFLSGGIDSSLLVALMQAQSKSTSPVKTFAIGFSDKQYDEAPYAKAIASHLGTEHTEVYVSPNEMMEVVPRLPYIYDEPFGDAAQIPTFLISQIARRNVTVVFSGEGGDELFGGYNRYLWLQSIFKKIGWLPLSTKRLLSRMILALSPTAWDNLFLVLPPALLGNLAVNLPGYSLHKIARILDCTTQEEMYDGLVSFWNTATLMPDVVKQPIIVSDSKSRPTISNSAQLMMYWDQMTYLPGNGLVKTDRATMAASLEGRMPLLDQRLLEFSWRLPLDMKMRDNTGKWLLRQVLQRYVPNELFDRPKMGFAVPIDNWLRGPLREWAESLLDPRRLGEEGFFEAAPIRSKWEQHLSGSRNWSYHLWGILMFQAWLEKSREDGA